MATQGVTMEGTMMVPTTCTPSYSREECAILVLYQYLVHVIWLLSRTEYNSRWNGGISVAPQSVNYFHLCVRGSYVYSLKSSVFVMLCEMSEKAQNLPVGILQSGMAVGRQGNQHLWRSGLGLGLQLTERKQGSVQILSPQLP